VAKLIQLFGKLDAKQLLESGKQGRVRSRSVDGFCSAMKLRRRNQKSTSRSPTSCSADAADTVRLFDEASAGAAWEKANVKL
jgi:hypothetical protein